jgi:hypothetical protein
MMKNSIFSVIGIFYATVLGAKKILNERKYIVKVGSMWVKKVKYDCIVVTIQQKHAHCFSNQDIALAIADILRGDVIPFSISNKPIIENFVPEILEPADLKGIPNFPEKDYHGFGCCCPSNSSNEEMLKRVPAPAIGRVLKSGIEVLDKNIK